MHLRKFRGPHDAVRCQVELQLLIPLLKGTSTKDGSRNVASQQGHVNGRQLLLALHRTNRQRGQVGRITVRVEDESTKADVVVGCVEGVGSEGVACAAHSVAQG